MAQPPEAPAASDRRPDLLGLPLAELEEAVAPWIDRSFRAGQIYRALHRRGVSDFAEMTDLALDLRRELAKSFRIGTPRPVREALSADGTRKLLFRLEDGATVETVDIPEARRRTLCLSSQAGCALGCRFCVTGYWGAGRNLTSGEIVGQVLATRAGQEPFEGGLNLVFMGMGEPLQNLAAVGRALEILTEEISWRRITLSTVGVVPGIEELAGWQRRPNLAISLHAPDDARRGELMPINKSYPLAELKAALAEYPLERGRRLTFEYLLIRDFNDRPEDPEALARYLDGLDAKVNLIPVNPDPVLGDRMVPPSPERVEAFREALGRHGLVATVRRRRGDDVSAACGQLRAPEREPRGFRRSNLSL